jgi:hypothetical protein
VRITYGPFKVKGSGSKQWQGNSISLDPQGTGWGYLAEDFPTNVTALTSRMFITLEDGQEISNNAGIYNHHALFLDISKGFSSSDLQCGDDKSKFIPIINSIAGSAADASGQEPWLNTTRPTVGNFIDASHKVFLTGDLVNYNNETKEVYMVSEMQYVEGKAKGTMETSINIVAVGTCEAKGLLGPLGLYFLKPPRDQKKWTIKGGGLEIKDDGKLLAVRGHMHGQYWQYIFRIDSYKFFRWRGEYGIQGQRRSCLQLRGPI